MKGKKTYANELQMVGDSLLALTAEGTFQL